jgi:pyrroline-5-carboxylate reductase
MSAAAMSLASFSRPLVMIGCGNMAGAMLARWLGAGLDSAQVTVVDPGRTAPPASGVTLLAALPEAFPASAVVVLGVKPQSLPDVAPFLAPAGRAKGISSSPCLRGVTVESLRAVLGPGANIARIMPNTPVALGKGVVALYADADTPVTDAHTLLSPLGAGGTHRG